AREFVAPARQLLLALEQCVARRLPLLTSAYLVLSHGSRLPRLGFWFLANRLRSQASCHLMASPSFRGLVIRPAWPPCPTTRRCGWRRSPAFPAPPPSACR